MSMKTLSRFACLAALVAVALAPPRQAEASFRLQVVDTSTGTGVTITDNGPGDQSGSTAGVITYNGFISTNFLVSVTTGLSQPALAGQQMDLNSVNVTSLAGFNPAATLVITLEDNTFTGGAAGITSHIGGTVAPGGTLTSQAWGNASALVPNLGADTLTTPGGTPTTIPAGSVPTFSPAFFTTGPSFSHSEGNSAFSASGNFSMFIQERLTFTLGGQTTSFDHNLLTSPEPGTMAMAATGLPALGIFLARRRKARAKARADRSEAN